MTNHAGSISHFLASLPVVELTPHVEERSGKRKDNGEPYRIRSQVGYFVTRDQFGAELRAQVRVSLADDMGAYAAGRYVLGGASLTVGQYGDFALRRNAALVPIPEALANVAAREAAGPTAAKAA